MQTHVSTRQTDTHRRAKLYRWRTAHGDPAEWKERKRGELKILHNTINNNVCILMRRDKTLKVCANHFKVPWMKLTPKSDEEPKTKMFAATFGTLENANVFNEKFDEARHLAKHKNSAQIVFFAGTGHGRKYNESSDTEYDSHYKPIISLPEAVVSTNEEDEIEILKIRSKLYRWSAAPGDPAE
ncbi:hypothetical protein WA026_014971 [Henosepilachna vigintioctopunctata]|uniref:RanBD1 domain-containing protein n=1 Tax=Henosepilachna vigintioctopunctata TaxID=420089 RepID=A0AAW1U6V3_9CUCU